jgi:DNA repair protein RAD51/nuclear pore complex protein Nup160
VAHNRISLLLSYAFANLSQEVDSILASLAHKTLNVVSQTGPAYHKILFAYRVQRGDHRGGAQCLWDYLQRLKSSGEVVRDPSDARLVDAYLACINALRCCSNEDAWVLDDPTPAAAAGPDRVASFVSKLSLGPALEKGAVSVGATAPVGGVPTSGLRPKAGAQSKRKRRVVLLADVRREYQALLDRIAELEAGKFAFGDEDGGDDEMELEFL